MFATLGAGLHSCNNLANLNVSGNRLQLGGAAVLARLLMVLKSSLRSVEAARNLFDDQVGSQFSSRSFCSLSFFQSLSVLCTALYHSRIELLDLEENHFTAEGFLPLARVLRQQLWLRQLRITSSPCAPHASSVVSTTMRAALRRNTVLVSLSESAGLSP